MHSHVNIEGSTLTDIYREKGKAPELATSPQSPQREMGKSLQTHAYASTSAQPSTNTTLQKYKDQTPPQKSIDTSAMGKGKDIPSDSLSPQNTIPRESDASTKSKTPKRTGETPARAKDRESPSRNPFRDPRQIPHVYPPTFVYPHGAPDMSSAHRNRFEGIVDMFRRNMLEDEKLSSITKYVDYSLKICGSSEDTSYPSILVFCRPRDTKLLLKLFNRDDLKKQYYLKETLPEHSWKLWLRSGAKGEIKKPLFKLYLWRSLRPRVLLSPDKASISAASGSKTAPSSRSNLDISSLTLCGSSVYSSIGGRRIATIGCVLQIGEGFYGLTASHALYPHKGYKSNALKEPSDVPMPLEKTNPHTLKPEKGSPSFVPEQNNELSDPGNVNITDEDSNDLEDEDNGMIHDDNGMIYEEFTDEGSDEEYSQEPDDENDDELTPGQEGKAASIAVNKHILAVESQIGDTKVSPHLMTTDRGPDLDWALIPLADPEQRRPNAFIRPGNPSSVVALKYAPMRRWPEGWLDVAIITSPNTYKYGVLQPLVTFLGGINSNRSSDVWTVIMNDQQELAHGDSGSLVVDAYEGGIYGHVIGLNPLGEVYVSPFPETRRQIREAHRLNLSLRISFANLIIHHLREEQYLKVAELLSHLDDLIQLWSKGLKVSFLYEGEDNSVTDEHAKVMADIKEQMTTKVEQDPKAQVVSELFSTIYEHFLVIEKRTSIKKMLVSKVGTTISQRSKYPPPPPLPLSFLTQPPTRLPAQSPTRFPTQPPVSLPTTPPANSSKQLPAKEDQVAQKLKNHQVKDPRLSELR